MIIYKNKIMVEWRRPGVKFFTKGHSNRIKTQNTPREKTEHREGHAGSTGDRGTKIATPPHGTGRGLGCWSRRVRGGGGGNEGDGGSQR